MWVTSFIRSRAGSCATRTWPRTPCNEPCSTRGASSTLKDPDRFEAWAYRLVVNACNAEVRRERHHRGNLRLLASDHPGDPDPAANVSLAHQLDQAFGALGVEHRTVVVLVHYVGLTPAEAATAMGTPIGTVRSRLHYALKHLRAALEADARLDKTAGTA